MNLVERWFAELTKKWLQRGRTDKRQRTLGRRLERRSAPIRLA